MSEEALKRYSSRKFWLAVAGMAAATGLCAFGRMSGGECAMALGALAATYVLGNVAEAKLGA